MSGSTKYARANRHRSPQMVYGAIALVVSAAAALFLYLWLGWSVYWLWLLAVNAVSFLFYRYDKRQAQHEGAARVPEVVLLLLSLAGGFVGAGFGMYLRPRHKVRKPIFVAALVAGAVIQAAFLYFIYLR